MDRRGASRRGRHRLAPPQTPDPRAQPQGGWRRAAPRSPVPWERGNQGPGKQGNPGNQGDSP
ncbi:hypothetical protein DA2_3128 [Desulfovibrio sp. A2]|nr:hypothetical protein DA2_3128 [Desulfovibrio sp. A2]